MLGQAEVEDFDPIVAGDEDVVGLEIAVDDPFFVGCGESFRDVEGVLDQPAARKSSSCQDVSRSDWPSRNSETRKRTPFCFTDVVNGEDVGMVQRAQYLRLMLETMKAVGIVEKATGRIFRATVRSRRVSRAR